MPLARCEYIKVLVVDQRDLALSQRDFSHGFAPFLTCPTRPRALLAQHLRDTEGAHVAEFDGSSRWCLACNDGCTESAARHEPLWSIAPVTALGLAVLTLGVYVPPRLTDLLHQAAAALGAIL